MPVFSILYSLPYVFIFSLIFLSTFKITSNGQSLNKNWYCSQQIFVSILLCLFIGCRGFIYTDFITYYRFFDKAPTVFSTNGEISAFFLKYSGWEKGFLFFTILCKSISRNYFIFQFINYFVDFIILYYLLKKYLPHNIIWGFLIYFIWGCLSIDINLLRNAKSIFLFILSLDSVIKRKPIRFFLVNFLGFLFHTTSLIYFPLYFVLRKKYSKKCLLTVFVIGNILFFFRIKWLSFILESVAPLMGLRIHRMIEYYLNSDLYSSYYGFSIGYVERFFSFFVMYIYYNRIIADERFVPFINCFFIHIYIHLYCSELAILIDRLPLLFIFSYWFVLPKIYLLLNRKNIFLVIVLLYGILKLISGNNNILAWYDNALINTMSYETRKNIANANFGKIIGE